MYKTNQRHCISKTFSGTPISYLHKLNKETISKTVLSTTMKGCNICTEEYREYKRKYYKMNRRLLQRKHNTCHSFTVIWLENIAK